MKFSSEDGYKDVIARNAGCRPCLLHGLLCGASRIW
jgi:hypothetical protein